MNVSGGTHQGHPFPDMMCVSSQGLSSVGLPSAYEIAGEGKHYTVAARMTLCKKPQMLSSVLVIYGIPASRGVINLSRTR